MNTYTDEKLIELRDAAKPLMDFLRKHHHPHVKAIVDSDRVEVVEGLANEFREGFTPWTNSQETLDESCEVNKTTVWNLNLPLSWVLNTHKQLGIEPDPEYIALLKMKSTEPELPTVHQQTLAPLDKLPDSAGK